MGKQSDNVRLNVGGKIFETTATTLASASRNSMFGAMFDDEWNLRPKRGANEEYFIDRNPDCFSVLLDLLRTGELYVPPHIPDRVFYMDALYYGLMDHVRAAKIGKFNHNWLKLKSSVMGQDSGNWYAIAASPDGGCAVADYRVVRVYDWMLEEHPPFNLDYQIIKDFMWIDTENIVISSFEIAGGMGLFSSSTGDLRHRYTFTNENDQVKGFAAGALCFNNSDSKIFASCRGISKAGIGVWDQVTGKQIDLFDSLEETPLDDADKIQWLNGSNCAFVSRLRSSTTDKDHISLLDFRDKSTLVFSRTSRSMEHTISTSRLIYDVVDAIPMDESYSICVVDVHENLGFIDLRSTNESVRWNSEMVGYGYSMEIKDPKLTFHGGQLFCSMNNKISVYDVALDNWIMTSSLTRSRGGSVMDFSIGGDRLFALHSEENVFDVWETPSNPII
ncbi:hypothetical protein MKX03_008361 [Papaver bracteatum]|nr:hypothetical protein MKX03_008361 [Papaver bracteatum]